MRFLEQFWMARRRSTFIPATEMVPVVEPWSLASLFFFSESSRSLVLSMSKDFDGFAKLLLEGDILCRWKKWWVFRFLFFLMLDVHRIRYYRAGPYLFSCGFIRLYWQSFRDVLLREKLVESNAVLLISLANFLSGFLKWQDGLNIPRRAVCYLRIERESYLCVQGLQIFEWQENQEVEKSKSDESRNVETQRNLKR